MFLYYLFGIVLSIGKMNYADECEFSVKFWNNVICEYTKGDYRLIESYPNEEVNYEDGTP